MSKKRAGTVKRVGTIVRIEIARGNSWLTVKLRGEPAGTARKKVSLEHAQTARLGDRWECHVETVQHEIARLTQAGCDDCFDGHAESCESAVPAHDLGDLIARAPCEGCCPNDCKPNYLKRLERETAARARVRKGMGKP